MTTFEELTQAIPNLSREQLTNLKARISFLLDNSIVGKARKDARNGERTTGQDFYHQLATVLTQHGYAYLPYSAFAGTNLFRQFNVRLETIDLLLEQAGNPTSTRLRAHFLRCTAQCIVRSLEANHVPVSLRTAVLNMDKAPQYIDDAFPGYIAAGMLPVLANAEDFTWGKNDVDQR